MPRTSGTFKKGQGGKKKGSLNRTTKETKKLLEQILLGQVDNIQQAFEKLKSDPGRYLDACAKLFTYVLPKKTDITSDDKPINITLPLVIIKTKNG